MTVALLAVLGPLAAAALIVLLRRAGAALALAGSLVSVLAAGLTLARVAAGSSYAMSYAWTPGLLLVMEVDPVSALLAVMVAVVGFLVLVYAVGYMADELSPARFYGAMSLFLAAMQLFVLAGDWVLLLGAWELIALASYLLIGYWYERQDARAAATRAFLTTRAADVGLYLGVFLLATAAGTTRISDTLRLGGAVGAAAGLLLLLAAAGKAAQVPFQGWLADAMAGPTPVSALLHSATLVAAGVILLIRAFPLLPNGVLLTVGLLGGATTILTGLTALAQRDLKRLLAASTASQLGLMLLGLGAGSPAAATFHLVMHAVMKSGLFLGAGIFQHARESTAFDRLRGVGREHPAVYAGFALSGLALAGLPPLAGFWSKDAILAATFAAGAAWLLGPLALGGSLLSAMYVARALRLLWRGEAHSAESRVSVWMSAPFGLLALAAALLGVAVVPMEELLGARLPQSTIAVALGIVVAVAGLAAGWMFPAASILRAIRPWAEAGFRLDGGLDGLAARPMGSIARAIDRLDAGIHGVVLAVGRRAVVAAGAARSTDAAVHRLVAAVGACALSAARAVRATDERGIEVLIAGLVQRTRELGQRARRLQTGLVHRELALAVGGIAAVILLLALSTLIS